MDREGTGSKSPHDLDPRDWNPDNWGSDWWRPENWDIPSPRRARLRAAVRIALFVVASVFITGLGIAAWGARASGPANAEACFVSGDQLEDAFRTAFTMDEPSAAPPGLCQYRSDPPSRMRALLGFAALDDHPAATPFGSLIESFETPGDVPPVCRTETYDLMDFEWASSVVDGTLAMVSCDDRTDSFWLHAAFDRSYGVGAFLFVDTGIAYDSTWSYALTPNEVLDAVRTLVSFASQS